MTARKQHTAPEWDPDEAPDLSTPEWRARFDSVEMKRGRPHATTPKVSTTIRFDHDVLEAFKADGSGWQSRMNEALKQWLQAKRKKSLRGRPPHAA